MGVAAPLVGEASGALLARDSWRHYIALRSICCVDGVDQVRNPREIRLC